jgi:hypothetical protein
MREDSTPVRRPGAAVAALAAVLLLAGFPARAAAGDGAIEINDARAVAGGVTPGDAPGYPVTLSARGSYRLTGDLSSSGTNITIVEITSDDVTLDLNGFTVRCLFLFTPCAGNGTGVGVAAGAASNVTVRNGTVRDMASHGIDTGAFGRAEAVRAIANGGTGIEVGAGGRVVRSTVASSGGRGILAGAGALVTGNTVRDNTSHGIEVSQSATVAGNTVTGSGGRGIFAPLDGHTIHGNTVGGSTNSGIVAGPSSSITDNVAHDNGFRGIEADFGSLLRGNSAYQNAGTGLGAGIGSTITGNTARENGVSGIEGVVATITGNSAYLNTGHGIRATAGSLVKDNVARSNTMFGLSLDATTGYVANTVSSNGGTVDSGVQLGTNLCNGSTTCP